MPNALAKVTLLLFPASSQAQVWRLRARYRWGMSHAGHVVQRPSATPTLTTIGSSRNWHLLYCCANTLCPPSFATPVPIGVGFARALEQLAAVVQFFSKPCTDIASQASQAIPQQQLPPPLLPRTLVTVFAQTAISFEVTALAIAHSRNKAVFSRVDWL